MTKATRAQATSSINRLGSGGAGLCVSGDVVRGLSLAGKGKDYRITARVTFGKDELNGRKNDLLGLPLEQLFIKNIPLPALTRKDLQKAVELQASFHLPYPKEKAEFTHQLVATASGNNLLLLAAEKFACGRPRAILPSPLGLLGLALQHDLLSEDQVSLLLLPTKQGTVSLCLDGLTPVFMRTIPLEEGLATGLVLSAQAVYLLPERRCLQPQQIILFSDNQDLQQQIAELSDAELVSLSPQKLVVDEIPTEDASDWLLPLGLALLPRVYKKYRQWNVYSHPSRSQAATRKRLAMLVALLPLLVVGYYYDEFSYQQDRLAGIDGRMATLHSRYRDVERVEREVKDLNEFLNGNGQLLASAETWNQTVTMLSRHRPTGLTITALSGKLDGEIQISGTADNFNQVTEYARNLAEEESLSEATLLFTQGGDKQGVTFQLRCRRVAEAG